jgi:hypothetical protein
MVKHCTAYKNNEDDNNQPREKEDVEDFEDVEQVTNVRLYLVEAMKMKKANVLQQPYRLCCFLELINCNPSMEVSALGNSPGLLPCALK